MQAVTFGHLGLIGIAIRLNEALKVLDGCSEAVLYLLEDTKVGARLELRLSGSLGRAQH